MERFEINKARDGQFYFRLIAPNNEVIATSEMYTTKQSCQHGVDSVKKWAPTATVEDTTE